MINENEELFRIENNTLNTKSIYMAKVYLLLAISFVPTVLALFFINIPSNIFIHIGLFVASIVLLVLINKFKTSKVSYLLLLLFSTIMGIIMTPLIRMYLNTPALHDILTQAFLLTSIIFVGMSFISTFLKDVKFLGQFLFVGIITIIALVIINIFVHSTMFSLIVSGMGAILFSLYVLYDTKNASENIDVPVVIPVINLYLDIINLFEFILDLLGIMKK